MRNGGVWPERSEIDGALPHEAADAAILLSRYSLARRYCEGQRVLDVACGEGYGAFFMAERWKAARVQGVDFSHDVIARAHQTFASERVAFRHSAVEELPSLFEPSSFDVAISLDTIQHVEDPMILLTALKRLVRTDGVIIVSCPNEHRIGDGNGDDGIPPRVRRFTEDEFRDLTEAVLGPSGRVLRGDAVSGYINMPAEVPAVGDCMSAVSGTRRAHDLLLVPPGEAIDGRNCSYYVGIWGVSADAEPSGAIFPAPTRATGLGAWREARSAIQRSEDRLRQAEAGLGRLYIQLRVAQEENDLIRESASLLADGATREMREAIEAQTVLIDDRDAYIKDLERKVDALVAGKDEDRKLIDERDAYIKDLERKVGSPTGRVDVAAGLVRPGVRRAINKARRGMRSLDRGSSEPS